MCLTRDYVDTHKGYIIKVLVSSIKHVRYIKQNFSIVYNIRMGITIS